MHTQTADILTQRGIITAKSESSLHFVVCSERRVEYEYLIHDNYFLRTPNRPLSFTTCDETMMWCYNVFRTFIEMHVMNGIYSDYDVNA